MTKDRTDSQLRMGQFLRNYRIEMNSKGKSWHMTDLKIHIISVEPRTNKGNRNEFMSDNYYGFIPLGNGNVTVIHGRYEVTSVSSCWYDFHTNYFTESVAREQYINILRAMTAFGGDRISFTIPEFRLSA
jgi:hypothetical protein